MRGPFDDEIEARQSPGAATAPTAGAAAAPPPRPPGGKALTRLLQILETAGYQETASATVRLAVDSERADDFRERARHYSAAPNAQSVSMPPPATQTRRRRRGAHADAGAPDDEPAVATDVGSMYLSVGQSLGPPTPVGPQWRSLGPTTIPNGQTYGQSRVNVSGRVSAIAIDPSDRSHVLVGAANGGVWETRDRCVTWAPRTDFAPTLAVGALAFDPQSSAIVYCGTGEGNWWWFLGAGVLRSTDGGTTWLTLCTVPFVGQGFYDLVVDPANGQHLLAATTGGLYVSNDGGVTWTRSRTARTWSVSIAPGGGAGAEILAASTDGLLRSTDGGASWAAQTLPGAPASFDRLAVAITPSNPDVAYAWGASGAAPFLWRRAGAAWTSQATPPGVNTGQAWYDWFVAVPPDRDTQVYCGAIETHRGDLSGAALSWTTITNKGAVGDSIHPDQHVLVFEPGHPEVIYAGNDGGLFRSPNRGTTWETLNNGLVISEFEYLAQDVGSSRLLLAGTQDNGTQRWSGAPVWEHVADGDGGDCSINRTSPGVAYHTGFGMSPERSTTGGGFGSWVPVTPPLPDGEGSLFYPPLECSVNGGDTVAIGGDAVYISRDSAGAWTRLPFPTPARASAMYIPNPDALYVGATNGSLFRSQWNGASWPTLTALTTPRADAVVSDIFVDGSDSLRIWATYKTIGGGRVFRTDDGGSTWTDCSAGLPPLPINAIEVDPEGANRVWVAADLGVYQSFDAGGSWTDFASSLPNAYVGDLLFHPHARVLRAGTRSRGVWEIPVDGWETQPTVGVQITGTVDPNASQTWFTHSWPATWHVIWTIMPTTPQPGAPQVSWTIQVERGSAEFVTYWITVTNLTSTAVTFEGRYAILSRY